jgi:hypothetical protein
LLLEQHPVGGEASGDAFRGRNHEAPRLGSVCHFGERHGSAAGEHQEGNSAGDEPAGPGSEGNSLESVQNPKGVTGMKQDRAFERGVTRREGEKPCGRNVPGVANRGGVDSLGPNVEGA